MNCASHRPRRAGALGIMLLLCGGCGHPPVVEVESETVVPVKTEAASLGDIRSAVRATGVIAPAPGADLIVVAPEVARIAEMPKASGDSVRRGDVLVRFEIPTAAADVQRQQAEIVRAHAGLDSARAAQTRATQLFERGIAARREVEEATRAVADATAALAQAQASLRAAQTVAERAIVRATFDGVVATRQHNPGDVVEATAGDAVLRIIDPRRLEIVASVPIADVSRIELGASARLVGAPPNESRIFLKVQSRPAVVETGSATAAVRLRFSAPSNQPAGTPVQVEIDAEGRTGVVLAPAAAIVREGDETAVFVADGGKAIRRPVTLGLSDGLHTEIVSGLRAGEQVIVDGQAGLPDGASVSVANAAAAAPSPSADRDRAK